MTFLPFVMNRGTVLLGGRSFVCISGALFSLRVATLTNQVEVNGGYHARALTRVARSYSFVPKFVFGRSSKSRSFERAFKFVKIALQTEVSPKTATSSENVALSAESKLNNRLRPGKVIDLSLPIGEGGVKVGLIVASFSGYLARILAAHFNENGGCVSVTTRLGGNTRSPA